MRKTLRTISSVLFSVVMVGSPVMGQSDYTTKVSKETRLTQERAQLNGIKKEQGLKQESMSRRSLTPVSPFLQTPENIHYWSGKKKNGLGAAAEEGVLLQGNVIFQDTWTQQSQPYGIYSLTTTSPFVVTPVKLNDLLNSAGVKAGDSYYTYNTEYDQSYNISSITWRHFNATDWSFTEMESKPTVNANVVIAAAYDQTTNELYGVTYNTDTDYNLVKLSTSSLKASPVVVGAVSAYIIYTLATDDNGDLYAILTKTGSGSGFLVKIDKQTAAVTEIGNTGVTPKYMQSMTYDAASGKFYWAACKSNDEAILYTVDKATGAVTQLGMMPNNEEFSSLWNESEPIDPNVPAAATDLSFSLDTPGSLTGTFTFVAPQVTTGGSMLGSNLDITVMDGHEVIDLATLSSGATYSKKFTFTPGMHVLKVKSTNETGDSPLSSLQIFAGFDTPMGVTDLVFTENEGTALVNWTAPTMGKNGGDIDVTNLKYNVYRNPGAIEVATGITTNSFTETLPRELDIYSYTVKAVCGELISDPVTSNTLMSGEGMSIPYVQEFNTEADLDLFTILDLNGDGKTWKYRTQYVQYPYSTSVDGDDWLFTPALTLEAGKSYKLTFKMKAESTSFPENMKVTFGKSTVPAEQDVKLVFEEYNDKVWKVQEVELIPTESGKHFIGFYAYSKKNMFNLSIDSICVNLGALMEAPAKVADLRVEYPVAGTLNGKIKAIAPTFTKGGAALSGSVAITAKVNDVILPLQTVAVGSAIEFDYTFASEGKYTITMFASKDDEEGERTQIETYAGFATPMPVGNLQFQVNDAGIASVTWVKPVSGELNSPYDEATLTYKVVRYPGAVEVAAAIKEPSFTETLPTTLGSYYYEVTPTAAGKTGETAASNKVMYGAACTTPYLQTFDTADALELFTIYDVNADNKTWTFYDKMLRYTWNSAAAADDWAITPPIQLEGESVYRLSFDVRTSTVFPENLKVTMGDGKTIADQTTVLMDLPNLTEGSLAAKNVEFTITEPIIKYFGFYAYSEKNQMNIYIDNIAVVRIAGINAPGISTEVEATPAPLGELKSTIKFKLPTVTYSGNPLTEITKVEIFVNGEQTPLYTTTTCEPGQSMSYVDEAPVQGINVYEIVAYNASGKGMTTVATCYCGEDAPADVTNVEIVSPNGKDAVITWSAPVIGRNNGYLNPASVRYSVLKSVSGTWTLVASDLDALTYTDVNVAPASGQENITYGILATNSIGDAPGIGCVESILLGVPYPLPFAESFANAALVTSPWLISTQEGNAKWGLFKTTASDNDGGCAGVNNVAEEVSIATLSSPIISLANANNAILSLDVYHAADTPENSTMQIALSVNYEPEQVIYTIPLQASIAAWTSYEIDLSAYKDKVIKLSFISTLNGSGSVYMDHVMIENRVDHDLKLESLSAPASVTIGKSADIQITVKNMGMMPASGYSVEVYQNNELAATLTGEALVKNQSATFNHTITPTVFEAGTSYIYRAKVVYADDVNLGNNESEEVTVVIPSPIYPTVTDLSADLTENGVLLTWSEPSTSQIPTPVTDDMSAYTPFSIANFGNWKLYDGDGQTTYIIQNISQYDNMAAPMAYQVWTPSTVGVTTEAWLPRSGNNCLVAWASTGVMPNSNEVAAKNDDWLISPEVLGGSELSFYAKQASNQYGNEKFEVWTSSTTDDVSAFTLLSAETLTGVAEWMPYTFTLPSDAKYFAIRYVSVDIFALLIDDITYTPLAGSSAALELQGYNVYRNKAKINSTIVAATTYTDIPEVSEEEHKYMVSTVYTEGESGLSNEASIVFTSLDGNQVARCDVYAQDGKIIVKGAEGMTIMVFAVDGKKVSEVKNADAMVSFAVESGVYVVEVDGTPVKISVRK